MAPTLAAGLLIVGMVSVGLLLDLPPRLLFGLPLGLGAAALVLLQPFAGLLALVFGTQTTGLIERLLPSAGEWALEVVAALIVLGLLITAHRQPRGERFGPDALPMRLAVLLLLVLVVSALFAENRDLAWTGLQKRISLLVLLWLVVRMTPTARHLRAVVLALILATLLSTGLAVIGYTTGFRAVAPADSTREVDPERVRQVGAASQNATAASRGMLAGTALAAVIALRSRRRRRLYAAAATVGLLGTLLTFSRSTSLVIVAGGLWFLLKIRRHRRFPLLVCTAAVIIVLLAALLPAFYWERFSVLGEPGEDPTIGRRLGYQLIGLNLLVSRPLLGVGPENFKWHYMDFDYRFMPGRFLEPRDLHNMYLSVAVETGLLGAACFVGLLVAALAGLSRARRQAADTDLAIDAEAIQFALALFLVGCLFGAAETSKVLWVLTGLAIAAGVVGRRITAADRGAATPAPRPSPE